MYGTSGWWLRKACADGARSMVPMHAAVVDQYHSDSSTAIWGSVEIVGWTCDPAAGMRWIITGNWMPDVSYDDHVMLRNTVAAGLC